MKFDFQTLKQYYKDHREKVKAERERPKSFGEELWAWVKTFFWAIIIVTIINGIALASFVVPTGSMEKTVMTGDFLFVNKFIYGPSTPQVIPFLNIPLPFYKMPAIKDPAKGDVIVFIFPGNIDEVKSAEFTYYLKRCVATAGDILEVKNKKLFVNGIEQPLAPNGQYDYTRQENARERMETFPYGRGYSRDNYGPLRIPKKGDIINLNMQNIREWLVFIEREGHKVAFFAGTINIDGKPSNSYVVEQDYCFGMGDNRDNSADSRFWGFIPYKNVVGTPIMVYWSWDTNLPFSKFFDKIASVKWKRIFTFIK